MVFEVYFTNNSEKSSRIFRRDLKEILVNSRTLIVCTRADRSLNLYPNVFSYNSLIEHDLICQRLISDNEQIC